MNSKIFGMLLKIKSMFASIFGKWGLNFQYFFNENIACHKIKIIFSLFIHRHIGDHEVSNHLSSFQLFKVKFSQGLRITESGLHCNGSQRARSSHKCLDWLQSNRHRWVGRFTAPHPPASFESGAGVLTRSANSPLEGRRSPGPGVVPRMAVYSSGGTLDMVSIFQVGRSHLEWTRRWRQRRVTHGTIFGSHMVENKKKTRPKVQSKRLATKETHHHLRELFQELRTWRVFFGCLFVFLMDRYFFPLMVRGHFPHTRAAPSGVGFGINMVRNVAENYHTRAKTGFGQHKFA